MPTISKFTIAGWVIGTALWIASAGAADAPGVMPGDDALTCDQIYAQGMAESQRVQQERSQRNEQLRKNGAATSALAAGAMMTGGLGGTAQAAQKAVEAQADQQMAMLGAAPPSNPRMDRLKQLWAQKHCVKK
jgi:hypothetical protein